MKTRFIINPRSGRARHALEGVREYARRHGSDVLLTERPRHARELAVQALDAGCARVVAVGGDGTMNEVATALVDTSAVLGLIPCGSGDGLGRHLGIHGSLAHAFAVLDTGKPRVIDTGIADGHAFFCVAGLGFEAFVADKFNRLERRGFLRYLITSLRALRECPAQHCRFTFDADREEHRGFTVAVANSDQYGNDARIAPGARIDDGLLDLCIVPPLTWWNAAPLAARLFAGALGGAAGVVQRRSTRFVIERPQPGLIHTDGEVHHAGTTVEFAVRPASLRVVCPAPKTR